MLGAVMKRLAIALLAVTGLSVGCSQIAFAADLPVKAPPIVAAPAMSWTGLYAGVSLGGRWSDPTWTTSAIGGPGPGNLRPPDPTTTPTDFDISTVRVGGYLGNNWQFAPQWLVGLEGDLAWGNSSKTRGGVPGTFGTSGLYSPPAAAGVDSSWVKEQWDASIRARLGFLIAPTWLLYATGGVAFQNVEVGASCSGSGPPSWCGPARNESISSVRTGWTIGGGVETVVWQNWLARIEYRYSDYGTIDHTFFSVPSTADEVVSSVKLRTNTVLGGIAYKF
jgi:outer membrane immunogenic protein